MPFIPYEMLDHSNCLVAETNFVKSVTRRPKLANVHVATESLAVYAKLHVFHSHKQKMWAKRITKAGRNPCASWCMESHQTVFVQKDKLYHVQQRGATKREFSNPWLLKHIMQSVFKERK